MKIRLTPSVSQLAMQKREKSGRIDANLQPGCNQKTHPAFKAGGRPLWGPLTGPQWLYQVECHLRTLLRHDRFRSGGSQPQGPMGTNLIVVSSPTFHEHLYLPECSKQFSIQQFIA